MGDRRTKNDRLLALSESLLKSLGRCESEEELLSEAMWALKTAVYADTCEVLLEYEPGRLVLRASTCAPELVGHLRLGPGVGLSGKAFEIQQPIFVSRAIGSHPWYAKYPGMDDQLGESGAALPIQVAGRPEGVVLVRRLVPWAFSADQREFILRAATLVETALGGFRHPYQAGAKVNRLGALSEVAKTITTSPYVDEILQLLVNLTAQQFNYRVCTVRLLDERTNELVLRATQAPAKAYQRKRAIKLGESIAGRAIAENRPVIVPNVLDDEEYIGHDLAKEQGLMSMICVPLTIQDRAVGVLSCYTSEIRDFTEDEIKALETLAKQAAVSIEHAKLQVRSTLMQEMHHRVKNNLQQVASLLRLQMRTSDYKSLEDALNDSLSRVLAIASVHDLLSREDLDRVGIRSIAETLVMHQQHSFVLPDRVIRFQVRGDDVRLNMTQATQVALVLNELIQNAIEHGFKVSTEGEIHVTIEEKDDLVSVWVANSGDALPEGFDMSQARHLGLQLVDSMTRALGGRFKLSNILGWTVAEVTFPRVGE
ncbi:MAG: sensor histidine kinase [Fimbriimonadaceae bacterium]